MFVYLQTLLLLLMTIAGKTFRILVFAMGFCNNHRTVEVRFLDIVILGKPQTHYQHYMIFGACMIIILLYCYILCQTSYMADRRRR